MEYQVVKHKIEEVTFSGNINRMKESVVYETNKVKRALIYAYEEYSKHEGHDLPLLQNCYSVKEDGKTICTFGYHTTKKVNS